MMRKMLAVLVVVLVPVAVPAAAGAGESDYWVTETATAKALDFTEHTGGEVHAICHDNVIVKRSAAGAWSTVFNGTFPAGNTANPATDGTYTRGLSTAVPSGMTLPKLISFNGNFYIPACYYLKYRINSSTSRSLGEISVFEIDNAGNATIRLQVRGPLITTYSFEPRSVVITDGYLFKDTDMKGPGGATLYWGGGGGQQMNPIDITTAGVWNAAMEGAMTGKFVYSTGNGTDWSLVDGGNGRRATDQYGRSFGRAMPNGYRYNHLIRYDGKLWDYYGYYDGAPQFAEHSQLSDGTRDILTEPWGRFQMGTGSVNGSNRLFRVGFSARGDQNFLYSTTGGNWSKYTAGAPSNPNNGSVYWRGCTVIECTDDAPADPTKNRKFHSGLYAVYSQKTAGGYESGIWRYSDWNGGGWVWHKVKSTGDARVYTGGIFAKNNDGIYVGTTSGIVRRGMGTYVDNPDPGTGALGTVGPEDENPPPGV